jgi:hypothetical protein
MSQAQRCTGWLLVASGVSTYEDTAGVIRQPSGIIPETVAWLSPQPGRVRAQVQSPLPLIQMRQHPPEPQLQLLNDLDVNGSDASWDATHRNAALLTELPYSARPVSGRCGARVD